MAAELGTITVDQESIRRGIVQFNRVVNKFGGVVYVIVEGIKAESVASLKAEFEADWKATVRKYNLEVYKD